MYKRSLIFTALALAMACRCAPLLANEMPTSETTDQRVAPDIHEVGDDELATMRGRYTVGDNTVVWFGVEMVSTWQTHTGQTLQSTATLGLNFSKNPNQPQVTFVPTVTITTADAPLPTSTPSTVNRSVQSGGIANVGGLTQSVQLAGDHNAASNVTSLNIQNGGSAPSSNNSSTTGNNIPTTTPSTSSSSSSASVAVNSPTANTSSSTTNLAANSSGNTSNTSTSSSSSTNNTNSVASANSSSSTTPSTTTTTGVSTPTGRTANAGNATASSTYSNNSAEVNLSISGQGNVSQWIHAGSLGQTIALTTDNQVVTNQMIVSLVTQSIASTTSQVAHSLAQSMNLSHTIGH